jgi:pimeloyl-ACP methyl ester carboxylesterase
MATTFRAPGVILTEREHRIPLDHDDPAGPTIAVFTREVAVPGGEDRPYLLFLQGGPGFEAARPTSPPTGWMKRALLDYRVLLLDQRGTGRSTPVGSVIPGETPEAQAAYLTHFRADGIVRDAEHIRRELGVDRWSVLGQSFGGFTTMTYLSFAPDGLREAYITGGLAPVGRPVDDIYGATYARLIQKNRAYFARYPTDRERLAEILRRLEGEDVPLATGERLTARRFRQLGMALGDSAGFERLHHVLELPFASLAFLHDAADGGGFARNPLYATLHESSYADGVATRWSAERLLPDEVESEGYLTAEHVFPWMWEDYATLRPQREAADLLAQHPWPRMFDEAQLRRNEVPTAATIYANDLYVERRFAEETAATIRGIRVWLTDEFEHNGLRADGERVLGRLIDLALGRA